MTETKAIAQAISKRTGTKVPAMFIKKVCSDPRYRIYAVQILNDTIIARYEPNGEVTVKTLSW